MLEIYIRKYIFDTIEINNDTNYFRHYTDDANYNSVTNTMITTRYQYDTIWSDVEYNKIGLFRYKYVTINKPINYFKSFNNIYDAYYNAYKDKYYPTTDIPTTYLTIITTVESELMPFPEKETSLFGFMDILQYMTNDVDELILDYNKYDEGTYLYKWYNEYIISSYTLNIMTINFITLVSSIIPYNVYNDSHRETYFNNFINGN